MSFVKTVRSFFLVELVKGFALTFSYLFRKPVTLDVHRFGKNIKVTRTAVMRLEPVGFGA